MKTEKHRDRGLFGRCRISRCRTRRFPRWRKVGLSRSLCSHATGCLLRLDHASRFSFASTKFDFTDARTSSRIPLPFWVHLRTRKLRAVCTSAVQSSCRSRAHASAQVSIRLRFKTACVALGTMTAAWCSQRDARSRRSKERGSHDGTHAHSCQAR